MLAFCGLQCDTCPIFLATLEKDKVQQLEKRRLIADECYKLYNIILNPDEITDCDGCKSTTEKLFSSCYECKIRECAGDKGIENCAYCSDYACTKLFEFFKLDSDAKKRLEQIRNAN